MLTIVIRLLLDVMLCWVDKNARNDSHNLCRNYGYTGMTKSLENGSPLTESCGQYPTNTISYTNWLVNNKNKV